MFILAIDTPHQSRNAGRYGQASQNIPMLILAIDTSCDETSVAITWNDVVLANVISSQVELHKKYGGVVPFLAQRMHREKIDFVIREAMKRANTFIKKYFNRHPKLDLGSRQKSKQQKDLNSFGVSVGFLDSRFRGNDDGGGGNDGLELDDIDVFAVTYGPGLAPALQVGVEKAKELAKKYRKPLVAVNHMEGHIYSNFAQKIRRGSTQMETQINADVVNKFPILCLLVSGNHTEIVLMSGHGKYEILGETMDDACGEAFDKVGRMLSLGYPAGQLVERLAKEGDPHKYLFPVPLEKSKSLDFSYSGLKTSVLYKLQKISPKGQFTKKQMCDVCASFQRAAVEHLVQKTIRAVKLYCHCEESRYDRDDAAISNSGTRQGKIASLNARNDGLKCLLLGGGVVANKLVRSELRKAMKPFGISVINPTDNKLLGDNAAMIAVAAYYKAKRKEFVKRIGRLERVPSLRLA